LAEELKIPRVVTGDILREAIKNKTPLGLKAKEQMEAGALVSDDVVIAIVSEKLAEGECSRNFLLDGFPRTLPQAEALDKILVESGRKIDCVVEIDVSDELIIKRLSSRRVCPKCGAVYNIATLKPKTEGVCDECSSNLIMRKDDEPDTIKHRIGVYARQTAPLIDYYKGKGVFYSVDGSKPIEKIFGDILGFLHANKSE